MNKTNPTNQIVTDSGNYYSGPKSPNKNSKRSARRKRRKFVSLEVSSRKHRRAKSRIYINPDPAHRHKGAIDYHC